MSEIRPYTDLEKELHHDIQKLITKKKYKSLNADSCLMIFHRVYSVYALSHLEEVGLIEFKNQKKDEEK